MSRLVPVALAALFGLAVGACEDTPPNSQTDVKATSQTENGMPSARGERYIPDAADNGRDATFRGPMSVEESGGAGPDKRYRFSWDGGKHVVLAVAAGTANRAAVIDSVGGKPLTLAQALGARDDQAIDLLAVEGENGPEEDPNILSLCGVRPVIQIAMLRDGERLALATAAGSFGAPGAKICSNAMIYQKAP